MFYLSLSVEGPDLDKNSSILNFGIYVDLDVSFKRKKFRRLIMELTSTGG